MSAGKMTRCVRSGLLLGLLCAAAVPPATAAPSKPFVDVRRFEEISGDVQAAMEKAAECAGCHGPRGRSRLSLYPSLAAQPAGYTYLQLESYKEGWRTSAVMQNLAAALGDEDMRDLAVYYAAQPAGPGLPSSADVSRGAALYLEGDPERGVPPCQGCHGPSGEGPPLAGEKWLPNLATYPALAGLPAAYIEAELAAYIDGSRATTTNAKIMVGVARSLDEESVRALAAYLEQATASR